MPAKRKRNWDELLKPESLCGYDCHRDSKGFAFSVAKANHVCDFFEQELTTVEGRGAGKPFHLLPWQTSYLGCLFGWVDPATSLRRYRETLLYIPRKNGKSCLIGGLLDYVLLCDNEAGAQLYCAAADREQAAVVYRHARGMVDANERMSNQLNVYASTRTIYKGESFARVISADAASKHGYNAHLAIIDELHAQPNRDLLDVLTSSQSAREQPLTVMISTADYDRPSICNEKVDYACQVRDGKLEVPDSRFLPMLFFLDKDADWRHEDNWRRVNPSLGRIKTIEYMRREYAKACAEPSYEATFRRLELNQQTKTSEKWIDLQQWDKCTVDGASPAELVGRECWAGLDLSSSRDITALVLVFKLDSDRLAIVPRFWIPSAGLWEREQRDRVPYQQWIADGLLSVLPGDVIDYAQLTDEIDEIRKKYKIKEIAFDPWNASTTTQELDRRGQQMVEFRQIYKFMSPASKEFERLVVANKIEHFGNPVMRWMVGNCQVRRDGKDNIQPTKATTAKGGQIAKAKIDGVVAAIMAIARAQLDVTKPSQLAKRGLFVLG